MLAATADARGTPATRTQLLEAQGSELKSSIRNTYRVLLPPSRLYPKGLGWLEAKVNPDDLREQHLILTDKGKEIIEGALLARSPIKGQA